MHHSLAAGHGPTLAPKVGRTVGFQAGCVKASAMSVDGKSQPQIAQISQMGIGSNRRVMRVSNC